MNHRERVLAAIRGDIPDRIPWVPRLEFWYRARLRRGDMPAELRGLSLQEISDRIGVGYYATVPDFTLREEETDMLDHGIGIFNHPVLSYRVVLEGVERRVTQRGPETVTEYHTPVGSLRTAQIFTDEMLDGGVSIPWTSEHAIRGPADFEAAVYLFSHLRVEPRLGAWERRRRMVGDRGVAVGYVIGTASPVHHIMKELMSVEEFFLAQHDFPEEIDRLAEAMQPYYTAMQEITLETGAEVVLFGGNYDDTITHPRWFDTYILPALKKYADRLHERGKYLMTHTDGENRRLIPSYLRAGIDVADSLCPAPMTRLPLDEIRAAFQDRITIWGGIPSVLLCSDSTGEKEFRCWIDGLVDRYRQATRFVLGVSDMVTADASWDRLLYITQRIGS